MKGLAFTRPIAVQHLAFCALNSSLTLAAFNEGMVPLAVLGAIASGGRLYLWAGEVRA